MKYKIKYFYKTGNSFHTEDKEDVLEFDWENIELAKEALKRINEIQHTLNVYGDRSSEE